MGQPRIALAEARRTPRLNRAPRRDGASRRPDHPACPRCAASAGSRRAPATASATRAARSPSPPKWSPRTAGRRRPQARSRNRVGRNTAHSTSTIAISARADLVHRRSRGLAAGQAAREVALDILDHDDRVVDDDADRQHQPEQRQVVERIADAPAGPRRCRSARPGSRRSG